MQSQGKYATGQTAEQITIEGDGNNYQLNLPAYIQALETGRSPTTKNAVSSNPPMIDRIKQWCQAKGIPDKAAWAIKRSIDKNGCKGIPGIISEPLSNVNINLRLGQIADPMADAIATHLVDSVGLS